MVEAERKSSTTTERRSASISAISSAVATRFEGSTSSFFSETKPWSIRGCFFSFLSDLSIFLLACQSRCFPEKWFFKEVGEPAWATSSQHKMSSPPTLVSTGTWHWYNGWPVPLISVVFFQYGQPHQEDLRPRLLIRMKK